jgi:hypothetical protein
MHDHLPPGFVKLLLCLLQHHEIFVQTTTIFNLLTVRPLYSESQRQSSRQRLDEDLQQAMDEINQPKISDLGHIRLLWGRELSARFVA